MSRNSIKTESDGQKIYKDFYPTVKDEMMRIGRFLEQLADYYFNRHLKETQNENKKTD